MTSTCACSTRHGTLVANSGGATSAENVNLSTRRPATTGSSCRASRPMDRTRTSRCSSGCWAAGGGQHDRHRACGGGHRRHRNDQPDFSGLTAGTKYLGRSRTPERPACPTRRSSASTPVRVPRLDSVEIQAPRGEIPGAFFFGRDAVSSPQTRDGRLAGRTIRSDRSATAPAHAPAGSARRCSAAGVIEKHRARGIDPDPVAAHQRLRVHHPGLRDIRANRRPR